MLIIKFKWGALGKQTEKREVGAILWNAPRYLWTGQDAFGIYGVVDLSPHWYFKKKKETERNYMQMSHSMVGGTPMEVEHAQIWFSCVTFLEMSG